MNADDVLPGSKMNQSFQINNTISPTGLHHDITGEKHCQRKMGKDSAQSEVGDVYYNKCDEDEYDVRIVIEENSCKTTPEECQTPRLTDHHLCNGDKEQAQNFVPHATLYIERSGEYLNYEEELNYEVEQLLDDITSDTVQPDTAGQHCPLSDKTPANDDGSEIGWPLMGSNDDYDEGDSENDENPCHPIPMRAFPRTQPVTIRPDSTQFIRLWKQPSNDQDVGSARQWVTSHVPLGTGYKGKADQIIRAMKNHRYKSYSNACEERESHGRERRLLLEPWDVSLHWPACNEADARLKGQEAKDAEAEPPTGQTKPTEGKKGSGKGKKMSLKEQRKLKSKTKKEQASSRLQRILLECPPGCDGKGRDSPYFRYYTDLPYTEHLPEPGASVTSAPMPGPLYDTNVKTNSRASQDSIELREKARDRARKIHRERCLRRLMKNSECSSDGRGELICTDKTDERVTKSEHGQGLMAKSQKAQALKRAKNNKVDEWKGVEAELHVEEDTSEIIKTKKKVKSSKEKRKERRRAKHEELVTLEVEREAHTETEEVGHDSDESMKNSDKCINTVDAVVKLDLAAQTGGKNCDDIQNCNNNNNNNKKLYDSKMENATGQHSLDRHSQHGPGDEKAAEPQMNLDKNVEGKNVQHSRVTSSPSGKPLVMAKIYDAVAQNGELGDTTQEAALAHAPPCGKAQVEKATDNISHTDRSASLPHPTTTSSGHRHCGRKNRRGAGSLQGRVSSTDGSRAKAAVRGNEANCCWRGESTAAGDWACQNKAGMRQIEDERSSKRSLCRDRGDSDKYNCMSDEGKNGTLPPMNAQDRSTDCVNRPSEETTEKSGRQRSRQKPHRSSRKDRSRRLFPSNSEHDENWRSRRHEIKGIPESMKEDHQTTGSWEANNAVCESDRLCDPAVLVSPPKPEPHIRNRRLSPGSGIGGGGGGGCGAAGPDKQQQPPRQASPPSATLNGTGQPYAFSYDRRERYHQRGGHIRGGRGPRRESPRVGGGRIPAGPGASGSGDNSSNSSSKPQRPGPGPVQKARWVEDSLSLLKPPPAFPVKDSPAKLQPAVSYASKVKVKAGGAGAAAGGTEEPPGIGVLLQNQWGLSFISDGPAENSPSSVAAGPGLDPAQTTPETSPAAIVGPASNPLAGDMDSDKSTPVPAPTPGPATPSFSLELCSKQDESSGELLLTCRHLVEAMQYHMQEWNTVYNRQKEDPAKVVWYKNPLEQPA